MPKLTRYFIKAGLIHFFLALILAVILQSASFITLPSFFSVLYPVYFHLFMVGWITQMVMGVSLWMFPIGSKEQPRGSELLGWIVFGCLNVGLLLRLFCEPLIFMDPSELWKWLLVVSAILQWFSGIFYVMIIWKRVKGK